MLLLKIVCSDVLNELMIECECIMMFWVMLSEWMVVWLGKLNVVVMWVGDRLLREWLDLVMV